MCCMLSFGETSESEQLKVEVLRKHWTDADLRKRDAEKGRYMSNYVPG